MNKTPIKIAIFTNNTEIVEIKIPLNRQQNVVFFEAKSSLLDHLKIKLSFVKKKFHIFTKTNLFFDVRAIMHGENFTKMVKFWQKHQLFEHFFEITLKGNHLKQ